MKYVANIMAVVSALCAVALGLRGLVGAVPGANESDVASATYGKAEITPAYCHTGQRCLQQKLDLQACTRCSGENLTNICTYSESGTCHQSNQTGCGNVQTCDQMFWLNPETGLSEFIGCDWSSCGTAGSVVCPVKYCTP